MLNLEESEPESAIPDENDLVQQPGFMNFYQDLDYTIPAGKLAIDDLERLFT
jgi:hypothetical protein